jgi:hypothetical protein
MKKNEMGGASGTCRGQEMCIQGLVRRPERRLSRGWDDNIKVDLQIL